ncbi:TraB family protein [Methanofervidicoccus sp. A16]|uniref:TraB/GumN family protein n=1 Tax=Methanofervidicoccus sp. A16 TaxID=2607662 RepID=UPI00118C2B86|nr:TraB/GumN family protein [Methanofervidicoccus sp. A16]AXI25245.1 TraB family protein [Methanofervidicoccus sp. A16]
MHHITINNGHNNCDIYILGTAHVSEDSIKEVEETIKEIDPDLIAVELDSDRFFALINGENGKDPKDINIWEILKSGDIGLFLLHTILASFQREIGEKFNIKPGSEMKKAIELAKLYKKPLYLIDRPIDITLKRALSSMSLKEKLKLLCQLFEDDDSISKLDKRSIKEIVDNAEELVEILKDLSPSLYKVFVDERDRYMAKNIFDTSIGREKIVVVVGAGHVKGIIDYLKKLERGEIEIDLNELMEVKRGRNYLKIVFSMVLIGIILYGIYSISSNPEVLKKFTIDWILINGTLSALGVVLARGKLPSVISAFLVAPITSLIPVIGAGYIVGLVELKCRGITQEDIQQLLRCDKLKELMNNNLMRVLMVAALSSLGSAIGTFYFIPKFLGL